MKIVYCDDIDCDKGTKSGCFFYCDIDCDKGSSLLTGRHHVAMVAILNLKFHTSFVGARLEYRSSS